MANEFTPPNEFDRPNEIEQSSDRNLEPTPNKDKKHAKKAGDGTMGFMLWSIAGTVLAACSSPIFSDVADLTGGGGSSGDTQGGSPGFVTNGRWANTDIYVADENGTRDPNADAVGITDGAGNIIFNDEYINLDTLGNGERYMADLEGATEISTGRRGMSGEELLSLPYHGGVLIISPLTDLLANAYIETAPQDMTREEFYQVTLDEILGQRPQFDTAGVAIAGTEASIVTVEDVLNADNYSPFADNNIAAELVSLASTTLGFIEEEASDTSATERVEALTNSLDDTRGQLMTEADEDVLSFTLDSDSSIRGIDDLDGDVNARVADAVARGGLPVVGTPNGGEAIRMTEGENFVLSRANNNPVSLFGFEDPFDNDVDGQPGGEREPGQLVGIYIEAASMGGDIAVMFGDATNNVALAGADRVAASDAAIPAMTTVGGVTFYFVSEANLDRLVLRPTDGDFNTADESVNNPQIRFYVHDGEHATLADDATTLDGVGMLEIEVANVNDAPVVTDPGTALITSTSDSDLSGTFTASDADGDTDFRWSATPTSTPYGEFSFPDPANPGAWTFTLNEAAFDALPAGMDVPLTFDITANDGNGGVSDAATLTIMLQGQNDDPTDITTSVAALTASYDNDRIPDNGIFIATLSTEDADTGDTHTYTRGGVDGQYFSIRDGNGVISTEGTHLWLDSDAPGRVVGGTWEVVVTSTDSANATTSKTFSITRTDASTNLAPTDITTTATGASAALTATYDGNNVPDGGNGGHVVATLGTTDPNTGDTHTYSIVPVTGEASESFDINGNELILRVSASPAPGDMLEVTVRSTDAGGLMVDKTFTITRAGNADTATDTLAIASEGMREFVVINGVEFRAADDGAPSQDGVVFRDDSRNEVTYSAGSGSYVFYTTNFSQADIANLWNTQTASSANYVATIIEEMSSINVFTDWDDGNFTGGTDEADLVVTEGTSDLTASGWLQVTGATGDITFSRAGGTGSVTVSGQLDSAAHTDTREYTFAGDYGDLVIDGDGDWVYTLGGTTAQNDALAALQSGGTERFVVAAMETGGAMRTVTETISIIVNEAPAPLAVASEGVREHLLIYGVEFRALEDGAPPSGALANYIYFANNTVNSITVTGSGGYGIRTTDFSQANIADIWNNDLDNTKYVATIIEEMSNIPPGNTRDGWRTMEVGGAIVDSSGGRAFIAGTDEADRVVTEVSDLMASGWLQVTGGTGDITFRNGGTGGFTASGQLGGAAHTDTREYTFVGTYGNLVIDGDGDWVYTLGGTTAQDEAVEALTSLIGGAEIFEVEITRGGVMVGQEILITVNGVGESETGLVVTNEAVRAFVVINGVEFRVNDDSNNPARSDYEILFRAVSANSVITPNTAPGLIGVNITTAGNNDKFSQVNIARLFNGANLNLYDVAAIIREADESATERTITNWQSAETDFIYDFITASTALDFTVTEDDAADSTARGFLEVTGATGADTYTYTGGTTRDIGTGTNAVTYQIFNGIYGELIVDGDGNWTYEIDNTRQVTQDLSNGGTAIDDFDVIVTQTAGSGTGTGTAMIDITVNGAAEAIDPVDALATAITLTGTVTTLAEDADVTSRRKVADIDITDGDGGQFGTLERAGTNANLFQIDGTELFLIQSAVLNHEVAETLVVRVQLSEAPGTGADLTITVTDVDEGEASFNVASDGNINAAAVGDVLTVSLDASSPDPDGNGDGTYTYQWHRDATPITGETGASYTIATADDGTVLTVAVSYTDGGEFPETVTTSGVTVRGTNALATAIALDNQVTTLAEDAVDSARVKVADIDITDGDGGLFGTLERAGADADEFEIDGTVLYLRQNAGIDREESETLEVRVQLSEAPGTGADLTITVTDVDEGDARFNVGSNADIAAAKEGDVLTVTSDASNPDPDGNGDGTFTYQWHRGGTPIDGATSATYTIARADEGTILTVVVGYTDGGGTPETVTPSGVTVPVDDLATAIALSNEVTMLAEDADVTSRIKVADITITDGDGGRSGTLERVGANANLFQIDGTELFLRQSAVLNHEVAETLVVRVQLSEAPGTGADLTITVTDVDEGEASFNVASDGDITAAVAGDVLTVSLATPDPDGNGDGTLTYQWHRDAAPITGETSATYTIVPADVGTALTVAVGYTDGGGFPETVTTSGVTVRGMDDLATAIALSNEVTTLAEDAVDSARVKVADIDITDGDGGLFGTLELAGTDADEFEIDGTVLYLKEGANINYDAPDAVTSLNVRVQLSEATGTGADLTITVTNVDEGDARFNVTSDGADINAAIEGDVLTVSSDASNPDPDGNGDGTFTYQWHRGGTPIDGATGATYTIARADEGTILTVVVGYTDGGGTPETVTPSGVTVPVDELATAIALSNEVTMLAEDADVTSRIKVADITITDGDGGRSGTLERAGANANLFQIDGTELFLIQSAVLNHEVAETLVVRVQLSEATGTGADLTITVTDVDEGDANFNVASDGDIAAAVEGDVLTVSLATPDPDGNGDGTLTYQWHRDAAPITGETSASYTIVEADEGTTLTVVVKYTDGGGTPETVTISGASVRVPEDALATAIALDNQVTTLAEDAVDSARVKVADIDITDGDGGLFGTLQLAGTDADEFEIDGTVLYLKEGANINYDAPDAVTSLDVRVQLMEATGTGADLTISITNVDEGDARFNVASDGNLNAAKEGDVLTVSSDASSPDPDGNGAFTYQWMRDATPIASATGTTYTIARADEGTILTVQVTYTDGGGTPETVTPSGVTVPVDALATAIALSNEVTTLAEDADVTSRIKVADITITDGDGGRSGTLERAGADANLFQIDGTELFLIQSAGLNHETAATLVVRVQLSEAPGTGADLTISITNVDEGDASFDVTSTGDIAAAAEGDVLTVTLDASSPDIDGNGDGTFTYQWHRDGTAIGAATNNTYTIVEADEGTVLTVVVKYTDGGGTPETVTTSGVTVRVPADALATAIALDNQVTTLAEDAVDSARVKVADIDITDGDGGLFGTLERAGTDANLFEIDGTVLYLKEGANIDFEAGVTSLAVRVQLSEATGTGADLTISITNVDEGDARFNVASDGNLNAAKEGDELTVSLDTSSPDPDGNGAFTYQWMRGATPIVGATGTTYTIDRADEGTTLTVQVTYTDGGGTPETVTPSGVTVPVDDLATAIALSNEVTMLAEDADVTSRIKVADITITDGDGGRSGTLERAGTNANLFQIDGTELFLIQSAVLNHETAATLVVRVQLSEAPGTGADLTISITNVDEGEASFNVASDGDIADAAVGDELTVSLDTSSPDPDGNGTFAYQWQRNGAPILNANSASYTIVEADEGTTLTVVVSYTDGGGTPETVTTPGVTVPAPADLEVTNEAVRAFVEINGVEFRINADSNAMPRSDYKIIFDTTTAVEGANFVSSRPPITLTIDNRISTNPTPFSQANIARLFNEADLTGLDVVAIILDEDTSTFTAAVWTNEDFSTASTIIDLAVTEDDADDRTAGGFLQVTGATDRGDYTYTGDFEGKYGDLKIDPNGNWTYIIDNTDPLTQALNGGMSDTDDFTVTVRETGGAMRTEEVMIRITVNGAAEAAPMPVDTGDAVFNVTSTGDLNAAAANDTLTVLLSSTSDPDGGIGAGGFRYQWQRTNTNGDYVDIGGETNNTYTIVAADEGTSLRVIVSYTDGGGTDEAVETSAVSVPDVPDVPDAPVVPMNGFYHLPATGVITPVDGATSYSITTGNRATVGLARDRVTEATSALGFKVEIEDAGGGTWTWSASLTMPIRIFSSATDTADREFHVHAHNGNGNGDNLNMDNPEDITALFNRVDIIAEANPGVTSGHYRAIPTDGITNAGTGQNELFIGTDGDDVFGRTGGGTDVIFAREGDDTFSLGRNDSDVIYHRFSSSDPDWTNTDGGDTITNYVRSGANNANDTFIFVDTDTTDVATEETFIADANSNIRFYANIGLEGDVLEGFEIRFVDPDNPNDPAESTITINYHTALQPDITTDAQKEAFGILTSVSNAGEQEITDGTKFGHYFGDTADAFQVMDDSDFPSVIAAIATAADTPDMI